MNVPVYTPKKRQERKLEKYLTDECQRLGINTRKLAFPGVSGAPDRVIGRKSEFNEHPVLIELKDVEGKVSAQQEKEHRYLEEMGFRVFIAYSKADVDNILRLFI